MTSHFGKNPKKGGSPPIESILKKNRGELFRGKDKVVN